jgi:hypothetical protein
MVEPKSCARREGLQQAQTGSAFVFVFPSRGCMTAKSCWPENSACTQSLTLEASTGSTGPSASQGPLARCRVSLPYAHHPSQRRMKWKV